VRADEGFLEWVGRIRYAIIALLIAVWVDKLITVLYALPAAEQSWLSNYLYTIIGSWLWTQVAVGFLHAVGVFLVLVWAYCLNFSGPGTATLLILLTGLTLVGTAGWLSPQAFFWAFHIYRPLVLITVAYTAVCSALGAYRITTSLEQG